MIPGAAVVADSTREGAVAGDTTRPDGTARHPTPITCYNTMGAMRRWLNVVLTALR